MTVGEKIQYYRKLSGLSQEELGQKLLVSRQTISQWENDQTVPTIDNLLRLKEIFGVSVDELLGAEPAEVKTEEKPYEEYSYTMTQENAEKMKKYFFVNTTRVLFLSLSVIVMICILYVISNPIMEHPLLSYSFFVIFMLGLLVAAYFVARFKINKIWNSANPDITETVHEYKLFDNYLLLNIVKKSEPTGTLKIYYNNIDKIHDLGEFKLIESQQQAYPIGAQEFQNSAFFSQFTEQNPNKYVNESKIKKLKALSIFFIILCVFSVLLVVPCVELIIGFELFGLGFEQTGLKFLYLLVLMPIASIVFGIIACRKGIKAKRNIVVGIIFVILVTLTCFAFSWTESLMADNDTPIVEFEEATNYDLPEPVKLFTDNKREGLLEDVYDLPESAVDKDSPIGWDCFFTVDRKDATEFIESVSNDSNWITKVPNELIDALDLTQEAVSSSYYHLVYNMETGEYNKLPAKDGEYRLYYVSFDVDSDMFTIQEHFINQKTQ